MTITDLGNLGIGAQSTPGTSFSFNLAAAIEAGRVGIIVISSDNINGTDGDNVEVSSVSDSSGLVQWRKDGEYTNGQGSAGTGITVSVWRRPKKAHDLASASAIDIVHAASVTDRCCSAWKFGVDGELRLVAGPSGTQLDGANDWGSDTISGLVSRHRLYLRGLGKEGNIASSTQITVSSGFSAMTAVRSRNNAAAVITRAEYRLNTSTGETSNPALALSADSAAVFLAYEEVIVPRLRRGILRPLARRSVPQGKLLRTTGPVLDGGGVTGDAMATVGGSAVAGTGAVTVLGTASAQPGGAAVAATGAVTLAGTATAEVGGAAIAATGEVTVLGTGTAEVAGAAVAAVGTVGSNDVTGTGTAAAGGAAVAATGTVEMSGTGSAAAGGAAIAGTGEVTVLGTATAEAGGAAVAASGTLDLLGTVTVSVGGAAVAALGALGILGTITISVGGAAVAGVGNSGTTPLEAGTLAFVRAARRLTLLPVARRLTIDRRGLS